MKKVFLLAVASLLSASVCFAQSAMMEKSVGLIGVVKSVATSDPSKGSMSQVVVIDPKGTETTLVVSPKTLIVDKNEKPSTVTAITSGEKILAKYLTVAGINQAIAIKVKG